VKYISKTTEPDALANFKAQANADWQPSYEELRGQDKKQLHHHLITEQGHICCYCGERIVQADSHIEHFQPQTDYGHLELDYFNLLASCQQKIPKKHPIHCGMGKSDWFNEELLVSPLIGDCADFFEYTEIGEILPTRRSEKAAAATETIERLRLNIPKLQAGREGVIDSFYDEPGFLSSLSDREIDKLIHYYSCTDEEGQYQSYCQVIIYLLKQEKIYRSHQGD
jgi:uncharacterized protein (TIGR02646 family)